MWLKFQTSASVAVLTSGVCIIGCYVLTCLCEQFRLCALGQHVSKVLSQRGLFALMTLALGGVSVFAMNCLNLCAISLKLPQTTDFEEHYAPIEFKVVPLSVSVFFSCLFAFLGLYVSSKDPMFAKTKKQIVESFIADSKDLTLKEVKAISPFKMFYVISTQSLGYLIAGGMLAGCGAAITACLTMWAVAVPDVKLVWNAGVLVATGVFACFFSSVSFWILFRLLSLYPRRELLRIGSAAFMAFCIISTHYVGMHAITIRLDVGLAADDSVQVTGRHHLGQSLTFLIILTTVVIFCFLLLIISVIDLRSWLHQSNSVVMQHEALLLKLKAMHTDNFTMIARYMKESGHAFGSSHHESSSANRPSLLERSLTTASGAAGVLSKMLPLRVGKGKVSPGSFSTSTNLSQSQVLTNSFSPATATTLRACVPSSSLSFDDATPRMVSSDRLALRLPVQTRSEEENLEMGNRSPDLLY